MGLYSELNTKELLQLLENEAHSLRDTKDEAEFVGISVGMQKTLAALIAEYMMRARKGEHITREEAQDSTVRWLMAALEYEQETAELN